MSFSSFSSVGGQSQLLLLPRLRLNLKLHQHQHHTRPTSSHPSPSPLPYPLLSLSSSLFLSLSPPLPTDSNHGCGSGSGSGHNNNNNNNGGWGSQGGSNDDTNDNGDIWGWCWGWWPPSSSSYSGHLLLLLFLLLLPCGLGLGLAPALADSNDTTAVNILWEVSRGTRRKQQLLLSDDDDACCRVSAATATATAATQGKPLHLSFSYWWQRCAHTVTGLMLPHGYPHSVSSDYIHYSLWRGLQGIASQVSAVLSTQALLYAVGLGKGAIPTAAAINWVLKDGIGYLSKILLSKFGRHFDVNPKGWRLFSDLLENAAYGMEILTPLFPQHFVFIGAAAGAGRSAAALIQVKDLIPLQSPFTFPIPMFTSIMKTISL